MSQSRRACRCSNRPDQGWITIPSVRAIRRACFEDLRLFFLRAGAFPNQTVVLHVEPDLWGFLHQRAQHDDAHTVRVLVSSSGMPLLADPPDDLSGMARAIVRMREQAAPNVLLAYHISVWETGADPYYQNSWDRTVDRLGARSAAFTSRLERPSTSPSPSTATATPPSKPQSTATVAAPGGTTAISHATPASWPGSWIGLACGSCSGRSRTATPACEP